MVLNELIDDQFQYYNYRIQLELLAIVTATFLKHRQHRYDNISNIYKPLLPMLVSNRRELRHGAMECFTVICIYYNSYKPLTSTMIETNQSIKLILSLIENLSPDASNAFRFRLQRNLLPSLTDEGNITPGLTCDPTTINDPDAKFITFTNNTSAQTSRSTTNHEIVPVQSPSPKISANNNKLLHLAMPFVEKKTNTNDAVRPFVLYLELVKNLFVHPLKDTLFHYLLVNQRSRGAQTAITRKNIVSNFHSIHTNFINLVLVVL